MPVTVRRATRSDAPTLLKLIEALAEFEQLEPPNTAARERLLHDGWPEDGAKPRFIAWLAEEEMPEALQRTRRRENPDAETNATAADSPGGD